ncbi:MAG: MotA/TolQ/ExbB proton channel family protein [Victivallales bacterium]|nr:MotA/TolQ/ExbB proton channel family protein [Victivallales bacterium]
MGKAVVVLLFVVSIFAWTIMANKCLSVWSSSSSTNKFLKRYESIRSALGMGLYLDELSGPLKSICKSGIDELFVICNINERNGEQFLRKGVLPRKLTQAELDKIRSTMYKTVNQEALELDSKLGWLSVYVTASPFCGLFGTVWGVMSTFTSIASSGRIEINLIAPGISGALHTTVAGLVVAIPTVCVNTLINSSVNSLNLKMDIFVEDFLTSLKLEESEGTPEDQKEV